jgi:hypothetical protein
MKGALCLVVTAALLASGCAFSRGSLGDQFEDEKIAAIQKGRTTKSEILTALGAPDRIIPLNGRDLYQYYHYDLKAGSLLLILINFSRVSLKSDDLYVILGKNGVVEDVVYGKRTGTMKFRFWPFGD